MDKLPKGSGHASEMLKLRKHLDITLRHRVWILGGAVWSQGLDLMILVGLFQLRISYDSMISRAQPLLNLANSEV